MLGLGQAFKMAGGGGGLGFAGLGMGRTTLFVVCTVLLVSMETLVTVVEAACTFNSTLVPSQSALDLECECPLRHGDFPIISLMNMYSRNTTARYNGKQNISLIDKPLANVKVLAKELKETDNSKGRMRLHVRYFGYPATVKGLSFTCKIKGRREAGSSSQIKRLDISPPATPTTTTTLPPVTVIKTLPPPTIPLEDSKRAVATTDNTEDGFPRIGLYTVVAISCVLLIVIVVVIICFVRVRARQRREKLALAEDLELEDAHRHAANHRLINKQEGNGRGAHHLRYNSHNFQSQHGTDYPPMDFSPCRMTGQKSACPLQAPCSSRCQHQTHTDIHGLREEVKGKRVAFRAESVPLLVAQSNVQGQKQQGRRSITSEDEDDLGRRSERLLKDTPRRSGPRDIIPSTATLDDLRSFYVPDLEKPPYRRYPRFHRYSFPHNIYDDISDEECDDLFYHLQKYSASGCPRRSLSQYSLRRLPRYVLPGQGPLPKNYFPVRPSTNPNQFRDAYPARDYKENRFQPSTFMLPTGRRHFCNDSETEHPPVAFQRGQHPPEASPMTVRILEDTNVGYQDSDGICYETKALNPGYEAASYLTGITALPERIQQGSAEDRVGNVVWVEREVTPSYLGESPHSRLVQQPANQQKGPNTSDGMPPRRYRRQSPSSHPQKYNTTSMPRHRSTECDTRSGLPIHLNRSHPQFVYISDGEVDCSPFLQDALQMDDQPVRYLTYQPQTRRKGRRRSRSAGNIVEGMVTDLRQHPRYDKTRMSPRMSPHPKPQEISHLPRELGGELQKQMNLLSRDSTSPTRGPPAPLNVPVGYEHTPREGSVARPQQDSTQRKIPVAEALTRVTGPRAGLDDQPKASGSRIRGAVTVSDSSPNTTPPRGRRPSSSSSDNGSAQLRANRGRRQETIAEINTPDKPESETQQKRPVSAKVRSNTQAPVVCAAEIAESQNGAAHSPAQRFQEKDSARSIASRASSRREDSCREGRETARPGSANWTELGVDLVHSSENSANCHCSNFTEHNHSTTAKTLHPHPE